MFEFAYFFIVPSRKMKKYLFIRFEHFGFLHSILHATSQYPFIPSRHFLFYVTLPFIPSRHFLRYVTLPIYSVQAFLTLRHITIYSVQAFLILRHITIYSVQAFLTLRHITHLFHARPVLANRDLIWYTNCIISV